jgi:membrane protease YdiL (CAAX protease family)
MSGYGLVALLGTLRSSSAEIRPNAYAGLAGAGVDPWLFVVILAILPSCCEELLFRGALQTALLRGRSPARAIALGSVIFAAYHLDLARFPGQMAAGLGLGWLAWRAGSIWPGVVAHAVTNLGVEPVLSLAGHAWLTVVGRSETSNLLYAWATLAGGLSLFALSALAAHRWLPPAPAASSFLVQRGPALSTTGGSR